MASEAKWTPGPWSFEPEPMWRGKHVAGRSPLVRKDGRTVASCSRYASTNVEVSGRHEEAEANARLISAAPELYEALEALMGVFAKAYFDETHLALAAAALAKARGEQS